MEGINENETCTACAGTLLLEFGALSRYLGNSSYEVSNRGAAPNGYKPEYMAQLEIMFLDYD